MSMLSGLLRWALPDSTCLLLAIVGLVLELENEPGLISKIVLIVVPCGDVVNEAGQKIIGFYGPDSKVRGHLEIDSSTSHQIKSPITR